jgi:hypothetical protein
MKKLWMTKVGLAALLLAGVVDAGADDLVARIGFIGSIYNNQARQALTGTVGGTGEYGKLNLEVDLRGTMTSEVGTRVPEARLTGTYPVEIVLKVSKSGVSVSDSFTTDIKVSRRWITFGEYGSAQRSRPFRWYVKPRLAYGTRCGSDACTVTSLQTSRHVAARVFIQAGAANVLVKQVFKNRTNTLVSGGRNVGQVIGDGVQAGLLCIQACFGNP